jgi:hypothetical protein
MQKRKTNKKSKALNKKERKISPKKIIYVLLTIFLGKLLGLIAFEIISLVFVKASQRAGSVVEYDQVFGLVYSPLPAYLFWTLISAGAIGGFFLGLTWWGIIYVEHRRRKSAK